MNDLIVFNPLYKNKDIAECFALYTEVVDGKLENSSKFVSLLIKLAEKYNLYDNLFNSLLTYLLINNENSFTLALERKKTIAANLKEIVMNDFSVLPLAQQNLITGFTPSKPVINIELFEVSKTLQDNLTACNDVESFYNVLENFFLTYGVGKLD